MVFWASPAHAQTREEYDQVVAEAEAKVSAAQNALQQAEQAYLEAVQRGQSLQTEIDLARQGLQIAQTNYEQLLMLDPNWVRPTKDIQVSEQVPHTVQVSNTTTIEETALIPRTIQVPHTETIQTITQVPRTIVVPHTETITEVTQVPRTILVPHTETVREVTLVPREVTTLIPGGLTAKSYNMYGYNNAPPLPGENRLVSTLNVPNINYDWGGGQILNSGLYEDVIVNFSGNIQIPSTGTYGFYAPGDDGIKLIIDNNTIINDWYDKGGGGSTTSLYLTEGSHTITLWFYENGGGANVWLYWAKPGYGWEIVPSSSFGTQTVTETVYDEVVTYTDVTTYTEEIVYDQVINYIDVITYTEEVVYDEVIEYTDVTTYTEETVYDSVTTYRDVTTYTEEVIYETVWHTETVPDMDAVQPEIQNPELLLIVNERQANLDSATDAQIENSSIIEVTSQNVLTKQQELNVAQSELEAIPPFRELPPTPEKTTEPTPEPTENVIEPLPEPEQTSTPEAPTTAVEQAQAELEQRAEQNDTGVLPYTLADAVTEVQAEEVLAVLTDPTALAEAFSEGVGQTVAFVGELLTDPGKAISAVLENVSQAGLDMTDDQREKAQEVIVPVVIVSQIASMMVGRIK
jgi:hypothetical protein